MYLKLTKTEQQYNTHFNGSSQDKLAKPVRECQTILDFATRDDGGGGGDSWNS